MEPPAGFSPSPQRRYLTDRRRRPTPILAAFTSPGRRCGFRRTGEGMNAYVDRPSARAAVWAVSVILLSACDAYLTLLHVRAGGSELVPTMRIALVHGESTFLAVKMGVTAVGAIVLALHERFAVGRIGSRVVLGLYSALIAYHLVLVALR